MESANSLSDRAEWVDNFAALNGILCMCCIVSGVVFPHHQICGVQPEYHSRGTICTFVKDGDD